LGMPATSIDQDPIDPIQLDDVEPSHVAISQNTNTSSKSTLQITADELELFHAKLTIADKDGDLGLFKKPSLSRTSRCIIAYFRYFDPHAPFVHYASFSISKSHRQSIRDLNPAGRIR
jgi:hypothetical protein